MGMALEVQRAELSQQKLCCRWGLSLVGQAAFSWMTYKQSFIAHSWEGWKLEIKVSIESVTLKSCPSDVLSPLLDRHQFTVMRA